MIPSNLILKILKKKMQKEPPNSINKLKMTKNNMMNLFKELRISVELVTLILLLKLKKNLKPC
jgi:hypothetical protein